MFPFRNISKPTKHYTAKAIVEALLELQGAGIPAIPDVDAIICQQRHRERVCEVIGRKVFEVTRGVRCKVDGIRYTPPVTKEEKQMLGISRVQATPLERPVRGFNSQVEPSGKNGLVFRGAE